MTKQIVDLAVEIADARDIDLPFKLLKIKDILQKAEIANLSKLKYEIYKYDILEALSVAIKNEYGYLKDGWNIAVDLVKTFCICTTDFGTIEKQYQEVLLPNGVENILILAKRIQDKYVKSKAFSEEFLNMFRAVMKEYTMINANNSTIALKSLKSQRLFQLFLSDEQNTSMIVMYAYKDIFKIKSDLISKLDEKTLFLILDEIMYKMATSELKEVGLAVFQLLNTMCQMDLSLIKLIVRRYKGIKMLTNKWTSKGIDKEMNDFLSRWTGANKTRVEDQNLDDKATLIQKTWRGYRERKKLEKVNKSFAKLQRAYRNKKRLKEEQYHKKLAMDELKFQLMLEHRRKQRQRNMHMLEILEILPHNQINKYMEKHREFAAKLIQANYRGYRERKIFAQNREKIIQNKAAIKIQRWVRRWLEKLNKIRMEPAFYSRPVLDSEKREQLFETIRKHLDSLPPHPRTEKHLNELHDRAQRAFQDYVINQRSMRLQQQKIQVSIAIANNDADIILNCPKLSQVTEDDINTYYSHKSTPVMLAAKEAHKQMLRKQNSKWYELLMDDSDSDWDEQNDKYDELDMQIKSLNFNAITNNYYSSSSSSSASNALRKLPLHTDNRYNNSVTKRQRNQLKTNNLRKSVTRMMNSAPNQSRIWNIDLTEDNSKSSQK